MVRLLGILLLAPLAVFAEGETLEEIREAEYKRSKLTNDKSEVTSDRRGLDLYVGQDKVVDLEFDPVDGKRIAVGNPALVLPQLVNIGEKRQLVFKPLKGGKTTVTVRNEAGDLKLIFDINIVEKDLADLAEEVRNLFRDVEGVEVNVRGSKVFVDGEVMVPADFGRIYSVLEGKNSPYATDVVNLVRLSPIALGLLSKRIERDIKGFAPEVTTRVVNGQIWLEGTVESFEQARRAARVAELYIPDIRPARPLEKDRSARSVQPPRKIIQNFLVVKASPPKKKEKLVRVTVHFVELAKNYQKIFGFKWQPGFTPGSDQLTLGTSPGGTSGAAGGTSFTATLSSLLPKLSSAQDAGFARILETGTVVVRSGQPASLENKTQTPFVITGANGQNTTGTTDTGLSLAVTPTILGQSEDIQMDIKMQQQNLTGRAQGSNAPITANHKVETNVYVKSTESAALAGVTTTDVSTNFNKNDPRTGSFGGQTEPLFSLLRSKSYVKSKSQFVIFVTPQIVEDASAGTEDLKRNFRIKTR